MDLKQSPFQSAWFGTALENVGLVDQRPYVGTYGQYEYDALPALPVSQDDAFGWLADASKHERHIGSEQAAQGAGVLPKLIDACRSSAVTLPKSFVTFMGNLDLQARVRSITGGFLDLVETPAPSPTGNGTLIRFLADSQGCLFWYLYIPTGLSDHAVVCSGDIYGPESDLRESAEDPDPDAIFFTAESFEAFLCRFWIENELWLSEYQPTPMNDICRQYLELYRNSPASHLLPHRHAISGRRASTCPNERRHP